jgi:hypothetical protein
MEARKTSKDKTGYLFKRYVWLVDVINRSERIRFDEIQEQWRKSSLDEDGEDFPLRTFHSHRSEIEEMFGIIITCDRRDGHRYYIEYADELTGGKAHKWMLNSLSVNNLLNESHRLQYRILLEEIPSGQHYLAPIIEAMRDKLTLEISYRSFWQDKPADYEIEPYCVKVFRQRWYLVAQNLAYNALRIYSLDRIQDLHATENHFDLLQDFSPEAYFKNAFGIIVHDGIEPCKVQLKVFRNQRNYFWTLLLYHSQEEAETVEEYSIFNYYLAPTFDFRQEVLSHGDDVEALLPAWFR